MVDILYPSNMPSTLYYIDRNDPSIQYVMVKPEIYEAMLSELAVLREQVRWRKAGEETPEEGERCLVYDGEWVRKDVYQDGLWFDGGMNTVTHWRPMPAPPEAK